jgi:hypothetical protein
LISVVFMNGELGLNALIQCLDSTRSQTLPGLPSLPLLPHSHPALLSRPITPLFPLKPLKRIFISAPISDQHYRLDYGFRFDAQ